MKKKIEIAVRTSNYHIELNPSDVAHLDRVVVQEAVKEMAQMHSVTSQTFKVVVLTEVDRLTQAAQQALRRTMEKYAATCRLILICESASRVIGPLRSRCLAVRIPAPTLAEIGSVLQGVAKKENIELPIELAQKIAIASKRNLRRAILMLEACKVEQSPLRSDQQVRISDWERFIDDLGRLIIEEQSPYRLLLARNKLYELLSNCIPADIIMKALTSALMGRLDDQMKHQVIQIAAYYEHRMKSGSKAIFHLEAFVAKFMALYKRWVVETFGM